MEPVWVNYHKHTSLSNRYMKDSPVLPVDYWNELKRRYSDRLCIYTTVEHGWAGNYFKQYDDLEKFNKKNGTNIQWVYGCEAYWVKNRHEQDRSNCHIILLALTDKGRRAINKAVSIANKDGYYYGRPRVDMELLLGLPPDDVMVTTACVAFWNKYDDIDNIVEILEQHFPHFYLEVQPHDTDTQRDINRHILELADAHGISIIAGCDSHYITPEQAQDRDELLKSSDIHYEDEDGWYMDYPTYDELVERFKRQGVLSDSQIADAIEATNLLFQYETIKLDRSLKVPVINSLHGKTQAERNAIFEQTLKDEWKAQRGDINPAKLAQYQQEIKHDIGEIEGCNMADYFILSYEVMKRAQEMYNGILTPSGRGSAVSMFLNKLLRLTKVDKVNSPVLMYSERFLTKERVLDSHTPPDIDNNVSTRGPFIQAQRDLVGELGTYDLLAMGTLKFKAAWKMYARAFNVEPDTANEVSKQIDRYETAVKHADGAEVDIKKYIDPQYQEMVDGCRIYMGIYDGAKGHPCGCLCFDGDVEEEIGISLCKSEATGKSVLVANIESGTIDAFGYLKQDYLVVDSIGLTYDVYKEAGLEPFTVNELLAKIEHDDATWQIYADGYTQCVNQCEQPKSTQKVMRYKPKNIAELTQFIAAIRPSFQSMYKTFEQRQHFDYGIKALDDLLQDEYCSSSFILYQESLMKVLGFAGFPMSETYTIIKAISKKKDYIIKDAKSKFITNFAKAIIDTGETDDNDRAHELADQVWTIIENSAAYGFNCVSGDTVIKRPSTNGDFVPTVAEMYQIMHNARYARLTGHKSLHDKYIREGYGYGLSMKDGRVYKNKIVDIYKQPEAMAYLVKTKQGRSIKATANHKFPTTDGIKTVEQLQVGDNLYVMGDYKKKWFDTRVSKEYVPNYPKQGQCGFQHRDNGDSVVMEKFRNDMISKSTSCEMCGKPYMAQNRFEVHHIDMDRTHNGIDNYQWLCCSCHKKIHYANGRTKQYENGIEVNYDEIISIEPIGYKTVYDVEMSDEIGHNFVVDNGIVTCNSAHAYCMAIDSVTIAYLKAHYPLEFYKCVLQRYTDKGEKDKVSLIKQEMLKRGFKLKDIKFGDDNRQFNIDRANNCIVQTMASIKDMPKTTPQALYELGQRGVKNRGELYQAIMDNSRINKKAIEILFRLGYFERFGHPNKLIAEYEVYQQYISSKVLTKANFPDSILDDIRQCCGTETAKQFRDVDNKALIVAILKHTPIKPTTITDRIQWQLQYLGYCTVCDPSRDVNDWVVMDVRGNNYGVAYLTMYNLAYGSERQYKCNKKWWAAHQCKTGDVIKAVLDDVPKWTKNADGKFVKTGKRETQVKAFKVLEG